MNSTSKKKPKYKTKADKLEISVELSSTINFARNVTTKVRTYALKLFSFLPKEREVHACAALSKTDNTEISCDHLPRGTMHRTHSILSSWNTWSFFFSKKIVSILFKNHVSLSSRSLRWLFWRVRLISKNTLLLNPKT